MADGIRPANQGVEPVGINKKRSKKRLHSDVETDGDDENECQKAKPFCHAVVKKCTLRIPVIPPAPVCPPFCSSDINVSSIAAAAVDPKQIVVSQSAILPGTACEMNDDVPNNTLLPLSSSIETANRVLYDCTVSQPSDIVHVSTTPLYAELFREDEGLLVQTPNACINREYLVTPRRNCFMASETATPSATNIPPISSSTVVSGSTVAAETGNHMGMHDASSLYSTISSSSSSRNRAVRSDAVNSNAPCFSNLIETPSSVGSNKQAPATGTQSKVHLAAGRNDLLLVFAEGSCTLIYLQLLMI